MIQNRTMTVNSGHPASSKWWWIGDMRKMRRPNPRNEITCRITEHRLHHEQAAQDHEQKLGVRGDRQGAHEATDRERPRVSHEDARRRGVPPQEAGERTHHAGRHDGVVEHRRAVDVVAAERWDPLSLEAQVAELPERDEHVRGEHERARARREPVEPVGEVHGVRRGGEHEEHPDEEEHAERERRRADEGQVVEMPVSSEDRDDDQPEEHRNDRRADELLRASSDRATGGSAPS